MSDLSFVPYRPPRPRGDDARRQLAAFHASLEARRSVREFSPEPVPRDLVEQCVRVASTAPSGAHKQPWTYVAISDPAIKQRMRDAAEIVERDNYDWRMSGEWKDDLRALGTTAAKPHFTEAPWIVVVFQQDHEVRPDGSVGKHYYVTQSVGISVGMFLAAVQQAGLAALVHTPSPMEFLRELLQRPRNERAFCVIPLGYPSDTCMVPNLTRKPLERVLLVDPPMRDVHFRSGDEAVEEP